MIKIRTGYSFRNAAGSLKDVMSRLKEIEAPYAPITDRASTFGFYRWYKMAKEAGLAPVFGVELAVVKDTADKKPITDFWTFIAQDELGPLNKLVETATNQFYFQPILTYRQAIEAQGVTKITGTRPQMKWDDEGFMAGVLENSVYFPLGPSTPKALVQRALEFNIPLAASSDNVYVRDGDFPFYSTLVGRNTNEQAFHQHIQSEEEWRQSVAGMVDEAGIEDALANSKAIATACTARPINAKLPSPSRPHSLLDWCKIGAQELGVDLTNEVYSKRLDRELELIALKGFEDYFYIVADLVQWARDRMVVGPARGSSCGSLVCYLLKITTVDPIPHGLIFERFIDINRNDLPDIDIDFSDQQRHLVFEYIANRYGKDRVARLGTVANFHPKSAMQECGAALGVPKWKTDAVADVLIERSSGDSRALDTLLDTLKATDAGKKLMVEYPEMEIATRFEGHPRHYSQHAAGVVVAERPITDYVAVDARTGATMCDKKDAEDGYGLLKIDALGLTQLSIFEDALELAKLPRDHLEGLTLDDPAAFEVLNNQRWSGIFQFNGQALQSLTKQTKVVCFEDIVNITALARPGALTSGGASDWIYRKNGWDPRTKTVATVTYPHPIFEPYLSETLGVVTYQEQVMNIGREVGDLSWEDVTALRKAMSKSLGKEFFDQFGDRWKEGARKKGVPDEVLDKVWDDLCAYGAWGFNKSHSVAYGLISYWCCWLKAHFPFEFAAATLSHVDTPEKMIAMLREMRDEGFDYVPVDLEKSGKKWSTITVDGKRKLLGPLSIVDGIGPKMVEQIIGARERGERPSARAQKLITGAKTKIDSLSPIADRVNKLMPDPLERNIVTKPTPICEIGEGHTVDTSFLIIGVAKTINPRDENEPIMIARRGYRLTKGPTDSLNLQMEDDTGVLYCKINRYKFKDLGEPIIRRGRPAKSIYAIKGTAMAGRRFLMVESVRYIGDMEND